MSAPSTDPGTLPAQDVVRGAGRTVDVRLGLAGSAVFMVVSNRR